MIDTIRLVRGNTDIKKDGWNDLEIQTRSSEGVKIKQVTLGKNNEPRLTYYPSDLKLMVELSLPKYLKGQNIDILSDQEVSEGVEKVIDWVEQKTGAFYNNPSVNRVDYCYGFETGIDTPLYLNALSNFPVSGYTRSPYVQEDQVTQGFTFRNYSIKVNFYDKGLETGIMDRQYLRYEMQNLNRLAVGLVKKRTGYAGLDLLKREVAVSELKHFLDRAGIKGSFKVPEDVYMDLFNKFGCEGAASRFWFMEGYKKYGTRLSKMMGRTSYYKRVKELKKEGWLCETERELKGLEVI